jgi:FtsH-binding integral membrane protein
MLVTSMLGVAWLIHSYRFTAHADAHIALMTVLPFLATVCCSVARRHNRVVHRNSPSTDSCSALALLFVVCTSLSAYSSAPPCVPYVLALTIAQVGLLGVVTVTSDPVTPAIVSDPERQIDVVVVVTATTTAVIRTRFRAFRPRRL